MTATFRIAARVRRLLRDSDNKQTDRPRDSGPSSADTSVYGQRSTCTQQRHERRRQCHRRWRSRSTLPTKRLQLLSDWE